MPAAYASRTTLPPPMQGSLPAGGLRLYREGVEPSGSLRKVSDLHVFLLSRAYPDASWAHTRRYFYEFFEANGSPLAAEALRRIGELYAIEERIRGQSPAHRMAERRTFSKPLVDNLKLWLEQELSRTPRRGKLADAIRYALSRWHGLTRFLHDGRIELDTNPVERAIRPVALGRKNHLFAGSDDGGARWATLCSLIETAKLNDVEPYAYLHDVLQRMVDGHPINRLDELERR
jgi:transposase